MLTQETSDAEHEYLQVLVHRIATHIVEGSAAVQELKSTVARLKNERSDIEYVVYEHWLKAAKTIEAAGKEKSSWEKFIKSLRMSYSGDDDKAELALSGSSPRGASAPTPASGDQAEDHLLPIASQELWAHEAIQNSNVGTSTSTVDHRYVETVVDDGYRFGKQSDTKKLDLRERITYDIEKLAQVAMTIGEPNYSKKKLDLKERIMYDTEKLAQAAMTIGEPNYSKKSKKGSKKRKREDSASELVVVGEGGGIQKKSFIQFTNGRKVGSEKVVALKKGGRCFYCERKGHRAAECRDNPDVQGKL